MSGVGVRNGNTEEISLGSLVENAEAVQRGSHRLLVLAWLFGLGGAVALGAFGVVGSPALRPGRVGFHWAGVAGGVGMLLAAGHLFLKRSGRYEDRKVRWTHWHIAIGAAAIFLAAIHATGHIRQSPMLILLAAAGLWATGLYGRWVAPEVSGKTFARSAGFLRGPAAGRDPRLSALIAAKTVLLERMAPGADEGTFGLYPAVCLRHPVAATRFFWLSLVERRIVRASNAGARPAVGWLQRYWRPVHVILAVMAVLGVLGHIVVTIFFAGYAAGDQPVYWWHLSK